MRLHSRAWGLPCQSGRRRGSAASPLSDATLRRLRKQAPGPSASRDPPFFPLSLPELLRLPLAPHNVPLQEVTSAPGLPPPSHATSWSRSTGRCGDRARPCLAREGRGRRGVRAPSKPATPPPPPCDALGISARLGLVSGLVSSDCLLFSQWH